MFTGAPFALSGGILALWLRDSPVVHFFSRAGAGRGGGAERAGHACIYP